MGSVTATFRGTPVPARALLLLTAIIGVHEPSPASAQTVAQPGERIRVVEVGADEPLEGRLIALTATGLAYQPPGGEPVQLDPGQVASLEVARETSRWGMGLAVGGAAGAAIGAALSPGDECELSCPGVYGEAHNRLFSGIIGALGGAVAGGLIGSQIRTESWEPVVRPWAMGGAAALGVRWPLGL